LRGGERRRCHQHKPGRTITLAIVNTPGPGDTDQLAAEGDLDITSSLTINGNPSGTTINANQIGRVFDINADPDIFYGITPAPGTADQIGVSPALVNLGPLANNGGPTPTHALLPGSISTRATASA
jgi:hypothetical protein